MLDAATVIREADSDDNALVSGLRASEVELFAGASGRYKKVATI